MEFTNEEKERINQLYGNDFKDITPDDVPLIQRWEQYKTMLSAETDAKIKALEEENKARREAIQEQVAYSAETLRILRDKAVARYERLSNGEEE